MILSGKEILKERENGNIIIEPFNMKQLNPNSYNLRLANELLIYDLPMGVQEYQAPSWQKYHCNVYKPIDMKAETPTKKITIPEEGYMLLPGLLYLGRTVEFTETHKFLPCIEGRSSIGRLGINVHITAGFGDCSFSGTWTLELSCVQPVIIYPNIEICQIYYQEVKGEVEPYHGRYQNQTDIAASRFYLGDNY